MFAAYIQRGRHEEGYISINMGIPITSPFAKGDFSSAARIY